jgi:transposase
MDASQCPGCRERDQRIAHLEQQMAALVQQVKDLRARLGQNASNSSVPPSANPPGAPKPVVKQPSGKKPGGQPGHSACLRLRLPPERVQQVIVHRPTHCERCQHALPAAAGPHDPEPTWHQILDVPAVTAFAIEHQGHARTCPACGHVSRAAIAAAVRAHGVGPTLAANVAFLTGTLHVSKRQAQEAAEGLFQAPLALGTITALEQEMTAALAPVYETAAATARAAPVKNVDETSWKRAGRLCWLWSVVTQSVTLFVIHAKRGYDGLQALLGSAINGIVGSDRWVVYNQCDVYRRQLCWGHLLRDFQGMVDRGGRSRRIGHELLLFADDVFHWWYRVRDGTLARSSLRQYIDEQRPWLRQLLGQGARLQDAKTAAVCANLLELEPALWAFVRHEGVEPTNNAVERALRQAVLWRKRSFGCHSEAGCRYVERMLTVTETLRRQGRHVLAYLRHVLAAFRSGQPTPQLVAMR